MNVILSIKMLYQLAGSLIWLKIEGLQFLATSFRTLFTDNFL
jgi:hypothetical protein